jgi:Spy/CpxP family protein refolding chaperone
MKMHKISLLAALAAGALIALTPNLRAADKPERPNRPERPEAGPRGGQRGDMLKEMVEKLDLTADQKSKLQEALNAQREERADLRDATPEERRAKMQENRKAMDAKIKGILTAEQYAKWEKFREENRPGRPNGPGKRRAPGGPDGEKPAKN